MDAFNKGWDEMKKVEQIIQAMKKGNMEPIYLLSGPEYYFVEQFKNAVSQLAGSDSNEETVYYDLRETAIQDVLADAETIPFFAEKKIIYAEHPVFLKTKQEKISVEHDLAFLESYLKDPAPYTSLIFIAPYEKLDARKKMTKLLKKQATEVDCQAIKGQELKRWVNEMAAKHQIKISNDAFLFMESELSTNLFLMEKEIEKISLYVGEHGEVTEEIAFEMMSTSLNQSALTLVDTVLKGDLAAAIKIYKELEKMKEDPIGLIALLAYQFRIMYQVKLLRGKGYSVQSIQSEINVHPYVVKLAEERSRNYHENHLAFIMNELAETDTLIKQGKMDKAIAFEMLLYHLTTRA